MKRCLIAVLFLGLIVIPVMSLDTVVVGGTGANQEILRIIASEFMKLNPDCVIEVPDTIGSGGGIKAVSNGAIDIARVARELKDTEKIDGLVYREFGLSPVVFATNRNTDIDNLSMSQVYDIYRGTQNNWQAFGGGNQRIYVIGRENGDSSLSEIQKIMKEFQNLEYSAQLLVVNKDTMMIDRLSQKPGAIGYGSLSNMKAANLNVLSIDNIEPLDPAYRIHSHFAFVYFPEKLSPAARKFLDFVYSDAGKRILRANNCLSVD